MKGRGAGGRARQRRRPVQAVASLPESGEPDGARQPRAGRAGRTSRRLAGWPVGRLAGWPVGRLAGWPVGLIVLLDAGAPAKVKRESATWADASSANPSVTGGDILRDNSGMTTSSRRYADSAQCGPFVRHLTGNRRQNQAARRPVRARGVAPNSTIPPRRSRPSPVSSRRHREHRHRSALRHRDDLRERRPLRRGARARRARPPRGPRRRRRHRRGKRGVPHPGPCRPLSARTRTS